MTLIADGIVEAQNTKQGLFGFERTAELMRSGCAASEVARVAQAFGQEDDITVIRILRAPAAA